MTIWWLAVYDDNLNMLGACMVRAITEGGAALYAADVMPAEHAFRPWGAYALDDTKIAKLTFAIDDFIGKWLERDTALELMARMFADIAS